MFAATVLLLRAGGAPTPAQAFAALLVATAPGLQYWAGSGMETAAYVALIATFRTSIAYAPLLHSEI